MYDHKSEDPVGMFKEKVIVREEFDHSKQVPITEPLKPNSDSATARRSIQCHPNSMEIRHN